MSGALELRAVVKHYRASAETVRAADGVSLTVGPGETVAIYGPSGAGKSTLLLLAAGLLRPDAGAVRFGGRPVPVAGDRGRTEFLRRTLGLVLAQPHMAPRESAIDNAAMKILAEGLSFTEARKRVRPWIERVGLEDRADHPVGQLSNGERQRVAIARVLAGEPRLLLADEPTASLDSVRSREILQLLAEVSRDARIPVLLVTHDPAAVDVVDRAHSLRDGHLLDDVDASLLGGLRA